MARERHAEGLRHRNGKLVARVEDGERRRRTVAEDQEEASNGEFSVELKLQAEEYSTDVARREAGVKVEEVEASGRDRSNGVGGYGKIGNRGREKKRERRGKMERNRQRCG